MVINILVNNQIIEVVWCGKTKLYYQEKGYQYTNQGEPFLVKAEDLHPGSNKHVKLNCDICGKEFESPNFLHSERVKNGKPDVCKSCSAIISHSKLKADRAKKKFDLAKQICDDNGYILVTKESDYVGATMDIEFICPKHGLQRMILDNFIKGHKCAPCSYEQRGLNSRNSPEYVESVINSTNGNKLLNKNEYISSNTRNLVVQCGKCRKNTFTVSFSDYYNVGVNQCRSCSSAESSGEKIIADYLNSQNVLFIREKKFDDCMDKKKLPFDFYLPEYNMAIEFDGRHHFDDVWGVAHLESTKKHDLMKNDYCKKNGIDLLRIPYWEGHNIEHIIKDRLKQHC